MTMTRALQHIVIAPNQLMRLIGAQASTPLRMWTEEETLYLHLVATPDTLEPIVSAKDGYLLIEDARQPLIPDRYPAYWVAEGAYVEQSQVKMRSLEINTGRRAAILAAFEAGLSFTVSPGPEGGVNLGVLGDRDYEALRAALGSEP